jgi:hypothetical protein
LKKETSNKLIEEIAIERSKLLSNIVELNQLGNNEKSKGNDKFGDINPIPFKTRTEMKMKKDNDNSISSDAGEGREGSGNVIEKIFGRK